MSTRVKAVFSIDQEFGWSVEGICVSHGNHRWSSEISQPTYHLRISILSGHYGTFNTKISMIRAVRLEFERRQETEIGKNLKFSLG